MLRNARITTESWHQFLDDFVHDAELVGGLTLPLFPKFTQCVRDCDEPSGDGHDNHLVWFPGDAQTLSDGFQGRVVMAGDESWPRWP